MIYKAFETNAEQNSDWKENCLENTSSKKYYINIKIICYFMENNISMDLLQ